MATTLTHLALPDALTRLAHLLEYPAADLDAAAADCAEAAALLALDPEAREERYTATFDLLPACSPYVSVHLFGEESYKRAALMAALNARYAQAGMPPTQELPDHLSRLLQYAAGTDRDDCRELAEHCLLGPLRRMAGALAPANPYRAVLEAAEAVLLAAFPGATAVPVAVARHGHAGPDAGCAGCASGGVAEDQP